MTDAARSKLSADLRRAAHVIREEVNYFSEDAKLMDAAADEIERLHTWFDKAIAQAEEDYEPSTYVAWLRRGRDGTSES